MDDWSRFNGAFVRSMGDYELTVSPREAGGYAWSVEFEGRIVVKSGAGFSGDLNEAVLRVVQAAERHRARGDK